MNLFTNKTVNVFSLTSAPSADTEAYQLTISDLSVHHQPSEDSFSEDMDGSYGKDSVMLTALRDDIKIEDKIVDNNDEYLVRGLRRLEFMGFSVLELRVRGIMN